MERNRALIIVDLQNDFISGTMAVPNATMLANKINQYVKNNDFKLIITTQDWHNKSHVSFKKNGGLWPEHCIKNTFGAKIDSNLSTKVDKKFFKALFDESYSGFYEELNKESGLRDYLSKNNITDVYVCGIAYDYCVISTAVDSSKFGFKTFIVKDLTVSISDKDLSPILKKYKILLW